MVDKVIAERFEVVLAKAEQVKGTVRRHDYGDSANPTLYQQWVTQSKTLLRSILPDDHPYVVGFDNALDSYMSDSSAIGRGVGVLLAAQEDFGRGYLWDIKERLHADIFDDFLEMAASLNGDGYKDAAAVIAGSTLEEHLRKLCQKSVIAVEANGKAKKASVMNDDLQKQSAYNRIDWRAVQGWLDIRNDAAHGHYDNYSLQQVEQMIDGIRGFMARNPA